MVVVQGCRCLLYQNQVAEVGAAARKPVRLLAKRNANKKPEHEVEGDNLPFCIRLLSFLIFALDTSGRQLVHHAKNTSSSCSPDADAVCWVMIGLMTLTSA